MFCQSGIISNNLKTSKNVFLLAKNVNFFVKSYSVICTKFQVSSTQTSIKLPTFAQIHVRYHEIPTSENSKLLKMCFSG